MGHLTGLNKIEIREFEDSLTNQKAQQNFDYLKSIGLHQSAYNLLYERYRYYDIDRETQTIRYFIEANRRLGDSWKISFEASGFKNVSKTEFLYLLRNDSYAQISLAKYF